VSDREGKAADASAQIDQGSRLWTTGHGEGGQEKGIDRDPVTPLGLKQGDLAGKEGVLRDAGQRRETR
jgi:hypothetical protein